LDKLRAITAATRKPGFLLGGQESNKLKCSFPQAVRE